MRKQNLALALVTVATMAIAACGDDSDEGTASERPCVTEPPQTFVPTTPAPATTAPGTGDTVDATVPPATDTVSTDDTTPDDTTAPETTGPAPTIGVGLPPATTTPQDGDGDDESGAGAGGPVGLRGAPAAQGAPARGEVAAPGTTVVDVDLERVTPDTTPPTTVAPKPEVVVPDEPPTGDVVVTDIEEGDGPAARVGDLVQVRYVGVRIADGEEFDSNYDQPSPMEVTIGTTPLIAGFEEGLIGVRQGMTRQIDIPAELAYGEDPEDDDNGEEENGDGDNGDDGDDADDSSGDDGPGDETDDEPSGPPTGALSFVIEVELLVRQPDPFAVASPSWCTPDLVIDERREGTGTEAEEGDVVRAHVVAMRGDNLVLLPAQNSWAGGQPQTFSLDPASALEGVAEGIAGMRPGGRRVLTIPPRLAWGPDGQPQVGLPADTDLIMIVDLVEVVSPD